VTEYKFFKKIFFSESDKKSPQKNYWFGGVKKIMKNAHPNTLYLKKKSNLPCLFGRTEINKYGAYVCG